MLDRVTGLQVFSRVAVLGSLSGAARALGMSQTMATKHLGALEDRLGVKLVHRTTRKLTLTDTGRSYLDGVERILADLGEADAAASAERLEVAGTLRLNAPVSFGVRELVPNLMPFLRDHPGLHVDIGFNDRVVDLVEEGWDLAVRIGALRDESVVARRLAPCRLMLAALPAYLARRGTPQVTGDLPRHDCLLYTLAHTSGVDRWVFGRSGEVEVPVHGTFRAGNGDALVAAAVAGLGLIYQPTFLMGDEVRAGRLAAIHLDRPAADLPGIFAVYPASRRPPAKVRAVIDFLVHRFGVTPSWDRGLWTDEAAASGSRSAGRSGPGPVG